MPGRYTAITFENDVKAEGTKPEISLSQKSHLFENDVKAEGTKPKQADSRKRIEFENDVKAEGTKQRIQPWRR